jgi:hypothetical protein
MYVLLLGANNCLLNAHIGAHIANVARRLFCGQSARRGQFGEIALCGQIA